MAAVIYKTSRDRLPSILSVHDDVDVWIDDYVHEFVMAIGAQLVSPPLDPLSRPKMMAQRYSALPSYLIGLAQDGGPMG